MENDSILTFIVTGTENDFAKRVSELDLLMDYGNSIIIHKPKQLLKILIHLPNNFKFRLLIHADITEGSEFKGQRYINELKESLSIDNFDVISGMAMSPTIKKEENFMGIPGITRHNFDFISTQSVIDSLKVYKISDVLKRGGKQILKIEKEFPIDNDNIKYSILTALVNDEYTICTNLMKGRRQNDFFIGKFEDLNPEEFDQNVKVFTQGDRMGMVESAFITQQIINNHDTDFNILGGVCGGRKGKVKLYDVIIPNQIEDIISGKLVWDEKKKKTAIKSYGLTEKTNKNLIKQIKIITSEKDFKLKMFNSVPKENIQEYNRLRAIINSDDFKIHTDTLACGAFVLKVDGHLEEKASHSNDKIVGYEMESYGFTLVNNDNNKLSLVVKSVMDYTDSKKSDKKQNENNSIVDEKIKNIKTVDNDNIPEGEDIKKMASYISFICIKALLPYIDDYLSNLKT